MSEEGKRGRNYLEDRGIRLEAIKYFGIGYANEGYFADRVTFPVISGRKVRNITSRLISKDKTAKSHLHLPKIKMDWFFHEDAIQKYPDRIILVESPINCINLVSNGYHGAVAVMGANNFNRVKAQKLEKTKEVFICFDNDLNGAGDKAVKRVAQVLYNCTKIRAKKITIPFILGPDINDLYMSRRLKFNGRFDRLICAASVIDIPKPKKYKGKSTVGDIKFDIMDLVQKYVQLNPTSPGKFKAPCPLHEETEPSFFVNAMTNRWTCFGCGKGGDAIDFLRAVEETRGNMLSFKQAVRELKS